MHLDSHPYNVFAPPPLASNETVWLHHHSVKFYYLCKPLQQTQVKLQEVIHLEVKLPEVIQG